MHNMEQLIASNWELKAHRFEPENSSSTQQLAGRKYELQVIKDFFRDRSKRYILVYDIQYLVGMR